MRDHRWYPTLTTLADGRVLITSGSGQALVAFHDDINRLPFVGFYAHLKNNYELFDPITQSFLDLDSERRRLVNLDPDERGPGADLNPLATYPAVFVFPAGAQNPLGVLFLQEANRGWLYRYNPGDPASIALAPRKYRMVATTGSRSYPHYGSMVLLPFSDGDTRLRVLVLGGQDESATDHKELSADRRTTATAEIFDYDAQRPLEEQRGWRRISSMSHRRIMCDATLLPDGQILVTGGASRGWVNHNRVADAVRTAELFDPATEQFQRMAAEHDDRRYHATALLLPDATVLKMGSTGGFDDATGPDGRYLWIQPHLNGQRFLPPYLWRGRRPRITRVDGIGTNDTIAYGAAFTVAVQGDELGGLKINVLRLGSVTHGLDMDQRCVTLTITAQRRQQGDADLALTVRAPSSGAVAPPGDYMLFVVDRLGVPSLARFVRFMAS